MPDVDSHAPPPGSLAKPDIRLERFRTTQRTFISQFESRSPQRLRILRWPDDGVPGRERSPGPFAQNLPALKWTREPKRPTSSFASKVVLASRLPLSATTPDLLRTRSIGGSRPNLLAADDADAGESRGGSAASAASAAGAAAAAAEPTTRAGAACTAQPSEASAPHSPSGSTPLLSAKALSLQAKLAGDASRLLTASVLFESIESGAIAPLRGSWIVGLEKRGGILPRRADLPPEACFSIEHLRRLVSGLGPDFGYLFVALSSRWLSSRHPDPSGFTLGIVAAVARLYLKPKDDTIRGPRPKFPFDGPAPLYYSPLVEAFETRDLGTADFVLFWDYASLYPADRGPPHERALHGLGVQSAMLWYAHEKVVTWLSTDMPKAAAPPPASGMTVFGAAAAPVAEAALPYGKTAWTLTEAALSGSGLKPRHLRLDLSRRTDAAMQTAYGGRTLFSSWPAGYRLDVACAAPRTPLLLPPDFEFGLVGSRTRPPIWTAEATDRVVLAALYDTTFAAIAQAARSLDYSAHAWGEAEARVLGLALPKLHALADLDLSKNAFDDAAAHFLAEGVRGMRSLRHLRFGKNRAVQADGAQALADAVHECATLKTFSGLPLAAVREQRAQRRRHEADERRQRD